MFEFVTNHIVVSSASMGKLDEESEELHQKLLEKDIDLPTLGFFIGIITIFEV